MTNTFEILIGLLDRFEGEVEGRELSEPPEEAQAQIRAFARGDLAAGEREKVIALLHQNPGWIGRLASEVKALRESSPTKN